MAFAFSTLLSTASLVTMRSAGVAARSLSLLTLAAGMPADRFGHYATAFVLSELARCAADFGLDSVVLRRAEGLGPDEQRPMIRAALAVRMSHGAAAAGLVLIVLALSFPLDLVLVAAGLQFLSQGWLQLGLNWRQVNNSAHRAALPLLALYGTVAALAAFAYFRPSLGWLPLLSLLGGEMAIAFALLAPLKRPRVADIAVGYGSLVPRALPMAGIMFLSFVNTRTDAMLVGRLLSPLDAGRYLYLARWVDFAPMLATGVALPMIGKLRGFNFRRNAPTLAILAVALAAAPFALVQTAALLNSAYASDPFLRALLAMVGVCRIGLSVATVTLLAQWRDGVLVRVAPLVSAAMPLAIWALGSTFGVHGIAMAVLLVELGNLFFQVALLFRRPAGRSGKRGT